MVEFAEKLTIEEISRRIDNLLANKAVQEYILLMDKLKLRRELEKADEPEDKG